MSPTYGSITTGNIVPKKLYQEFLGALDEYNNSKLLQLKELLCQSTIAETIKVAQRGLVMRTSDGADADAMRRSIRTITTDLVTYRAQLDVEEDAWEDMTADEADAIYADAIAADKDLICALIMEPTLVELANSGWWAGETDVPPYGNNVFTGIEHYHYGISGNTVIDVDNIKACRRHIQHHGYGLRPNSMFCFFNGDNQADIEDLEEIVHLPEEERKKFLVDGTLGKMMGIIWVTDDFIPSDYFLFVSADPRPVAFREHESPSNRGLRLVSDLPDSNNPFKSAKWKRRAGCSVRHRGAGYALQIKASGDYDSPSFNLN